MLYMKYLGIILDEKLNYTKIILDYLSDKIRYRTKKIIKSNSVK